MAERLTYDIAADLRRYAEAPITSKHAALHREAANKLDGLLALLVDAENARDEARAALARAEETAAQARRALELITDEIPRIEGLEEERVLKGLEWIHRVASEPLAADAPAAPTRDGGDCTAAIHGPACNGIHAPAASEPEVKP